MRRPGRRRRRTSIGIALRELEQGRPLLVLIAGLNLLSSLLEAAILAGLAQVGTALVRGAATTTLPSPVGPVRLGALLGALLLAVLVRLFVQLVASDLPARLYREQLTGLRTRVLQAYLSAPFAMKKELPSGRLQDLLGNQSIRAGASVSQLATALNAAIAALVLLGGSLLIAPATALLLFAVVVSLAFLVRPFTRRTKRLAKRGLASNAELVEQVSTLPSFVGLIEVHDVAGRVQAWNEERLEQASSDLARAQVLQRLVPAVYQALALSILVVSLLLLVVSGVTEVSGISALILLLIRTVSYGQQMQAAQQGLAESTTYLDSLRAQVEHWRARPYEVERAGERGGSAPANLSQEEATLGQGGPVRLAVKAVSFRFIAGQEPPTLDQVSFEVQPGTMCAVVGPSGAGKTSLLEVLLRLRHRGGGDVLLDGRSIDAVSADEWGRTCGYVPQDSPVLRGTVASNVDFFRDLQAASWETALKAAELDVQSLFGDGWAATQVGDSRAMSGGQAQRLSVARALSGDPRLLILDEPTSALDVSTSRRLVENLGALRPRMTIVLVAHRAETVAACDQVVLLEQGRVTADGRPVDVALRNGFVRDLLHRRVGETSLTIEELG